MKHISNIVPVHIRKMSAFYSIFCIALFVRISCTKIPLAWLGFRKLLGAEQYGHMAFEKSIITFKYISRATCLLFSNP